MINFTSILTAIKGANFTTKVSLGIGAVAVVAGSTAGTATIINANQPAEPKIATSNPDIDNSPSEQENTKTEEVKNDNQKAEQTGNEQEPATNNSQTITKKPSNNSSTSSNQSNNNSSTSKPDASNTGTSTSQPSQPSQSAQPTKKPDYNLNDRYVAGYATMTFSKQNEAGEWYVAETKQFFGIAKFTGSTADLELAVIPQYIAYAEAHGYPYGGGMGALGLTWDDVIQNGTALDEAKCAQYGLSCGRW